MTDRPSAGARVIDGRWRAVIRLAVIPIALIGLVLMGNETLEQVNCAPTVTCKLHLSTMLWGIGLFSFACLIWQKGDVSTSLKEFTESGSIVRGWWGRRNYDKAPVVVVPVEKPSIPVVVTADVLKDETVERPKYPLRGVE